MTSAGLDWDREKWRGSVASKFIRGGEKNAVKYADEIIVLSKDVQKYFLETYGRETHFIPNGVNRPEVREAKLITDHFGLEKDSYILFLGRLVPEKGMDVVYTRLCLDDFYFHLVAEFSEDFSDILPYLLVNHFPAVFRCEYDVVFTPIT